MTEDAKKRRKAKDADIRSDRIEHGSEQHMMMLGLKKAEADDTPEYQGFALADITIYGPTARPEFLEQVLRQKVREFQEPPAVPQSEDPYAPNYAPPMIVPPAGAATGLV